MNDFEKEVMWAVSGTGEDFQCVHVDFAREQQANIEQLRAKLDAIAKHPDTPALIAQYARGDLDPQAILPQLAPR